MSIKAIIFDCDGVITESVEAKTEAFAILSKRWGEKASKALLDYHHLHGGVSRLKKLEWLFKEVLKQEITQAELNSLAEEFAQISLTQVLNSKFVPGFEKVLDYFYGKIPLYVASGAPHNELGQVLKHKGIYDKFVSVLGSPPDKATLLGNIVKQSGLLPQDCLMVGDSQTDLDAANIVGTLFYGRGLHFKAQNQVCAEDLSGLIEFVECIK
ncbi:HAD family hydrolase [Desulfovibrio litoralis]|uniref:phosphoglycolate phosphatase n=1 Tax=Desulfovibrio litoralis DSM 11393 TaxID=1121455 RepID=A0A1M7S623_9BACT|nr:HAD family hydrolase [Desulfovibrio litoralis]SHN53901.1 Phosphoglycolate phosphatase, HAD superfamily [Desulfovibrio litoralis DSM 11393]